MDNVQKSKYYNLEEQTLQKRSDLSRKGLTFSDYKEANETELRSRIEPLMKEAVELMKIFAAIQEKSK